MGKYREGLVMSKTITRYIVLALISSISILIYIYGLGSEQNEIVETIGQAVAEDQLKLESLNLQYKDDDPSSLVKRIAIHKNIWEAYYLYNASQLLSNHDDELLRKSIAFQEEFYPFNKIYFRSVLDLYSSYSGKGIVITTGDWYVK